MKRALFGGSFDPIHVGHLILAQEVFAQSDVDEIVFMPANIPPHKQHQTLTEGAHRVAMIEQSIKTHAEFAISDVELRMSGVSYTADTLEYLSAETEDEWSVIIGADQMLEIKSWRRYDEIFATYEVLMTTREGVDLSQADDRLCSRAKGISVPNVEISATAIRQRVAQGMPIRHWVPAGVEDYIAQQGLYRTCQPGQVAQTAGRHE